MGVVDFTASIVFVVCSDSQECLKFQRSIFRGSIVIHVCFCVEIWRLAGVIMGETKYRKLTMLYSIGEASNGLTV